MNMGMVDVITIPYQAIINPFPIKLSKSFHPKIGEEANH